MANVNPTDNHWPFGGGNEEESDDESVQSVGAPVVGLRIRSQNRDTIRDMMREMDYALDDADELPAVKDENRALKAEVAVFKARLVNKDNIISGLENTISVLKVDVEDLVSTGKELSDLKEAYKEEVKELTKEKDAAVKALKDLESRRPKIIPGTSVKTRGMVESKLSG